MEKKNLDILDLGQDSYNLHYNNLRSTKKSLKNDLTIIESFTKSISSYKKSIRKIFDQIKQFSETEKPFPILKKIEIIIKLYDENHNSFLDSFKSIINNIKESINKVVNDISEYLNTSQLLSVSIKGASEKYFEKYDKLMESLGETEMAILEDYTKSKYRICLNKVKNKDKEKHVKESLNLEKEFLDIELVIKEKINNYIDEYNSNMKLIKQKMIQLNGDVSNELFKFIQEINKNNDNLKIELNNEEKKIKEMDKNINNGNCKNETEKYLNYVIEKNNKDFEIFRLINVKKYNIKIAQEDEKHLIENDNFLSRQKYSKTGKALNYTSGDVYNIVKKIYDCKFKMINKDSYILEEEKNKITVTELMGKLLNYNFDTHEIGKERNISKEENDNLMKLIFMKDEYFMQFLICLNNFRTVGRFEMSQKLFEEIVEILDKESKKLLNKNNRKISSLIIILSQTFYFMKDNDKYFLQNELKKNEFFRSNEFWYGYFDEGIKIELEKFEKDVMKNGIIYSEKKKQQKIQDILFSKFLSCSSCINWFDLEKEKIDEILTPLFDKYKMSEDLRKSILQLIKVN